MKDFKTIFWVILLIFVSVFIYQNQHFFFQANQSFRLNLILAEYKTPEISSALVFLVSILVGFCIAYVLSIPARVTSKKKIKILQKAVDSQLKEISALNKKLDESNTVATKVLTENTEKSYSDYR